LEVNGGGKSKNLEFTAFKNTGISRLWQVGTPNDALDFKSRVSAVPPHRRLRILAYTKPSPLSNKSSREKVQGFICKVFFLGV